MILFLIVFFSIYGGMHLYAFLKLRSLQIPQYLSMAIGLFMILMTFAPILIRLSERAGHEGLAVFLSWTGYLWMALIFIFTSTSVAIDIVALLLPQKISGFFGTPSRHQIGTILSFGLSIVLIIYGYFEALNIKTETVEIRTDKIKRDVRIVQISDVHTGLIVRGSRLKKLIEKVKEARPELLVSTGDLVDGQIDRLEGLSQIFEEIKPAYGKFAVTGNHEFYAGLEQALSFTEKAGFTILRGEAVYLPELNLSIAGVDDPAGKRYGIYKGIPEEDLLSGLKPDSFRLLLKHRPILNTSRGLFDLQLSGHTHKGQIFPLSIPTGLYYKKDSGCLNDINGCYLYVSRGAGTWGPPVRVFAPPEITIIKLLRAP